MRKEMPKISIGDDFLASQTPINSRTFHFYVLRYEWRSHLVLVNVPESPNFLFSSSTLI